MGYLTGITINVLHSVLRKQSFPVGVPLKRTCAFMVVRSEMALTGLLSSHTKTTTMKNRQDTGRHTRKKPPCVHAKLGRETLAELITSARHRILRAITPKEMAVAIEALKELNEAQMRLDRRGE